MPSLVAPPGFEPQPPAWTRWVPLSLLALALVVVPARILDDEAWPRYQALRGALQQERARVRRLRLEVSELRRLVRRLRTDPRAIERAARRELGMVRPDEIVVQLRAP